MKYFYMYLTACFIIANIILIRVNYKKIIKFFTSKLTIKQFIYRFYLESLTYLLVCALFPFIWPILIALNIKEHYEKKKVKEEDEKSKFHVELKDLIQKFDREEIESKEIVHDPLNAVPQLPFGHLHKTWLTFCEQLETEDALWSFSADWKSRWGSKEQIEGYVAVRKGAIGRYFRTH